MKPGAALARASRLLVRAPVEAPAGPFLKWAGGKSQLLPRILARLPASIANYFEPFIGGGAVFFALANQRRFAHAFLGDRNPALIEAYRTVQCDVDELVQKLARYRGKNNEADYYRIRARVPKEMSQRAARLIFLNKTGYNGLYRVNSKGGFNVPFGDNARANVCDERSLFSASRALARATLVAGDFEELALRARPGDAVYFDPPYQPISKTASFTAYAQERFDFPEQERLAALMHTLRERGVYALLSNSNCPETRALYRGLDVEVVRAARSINSVTSKRGKVTELLVSNGVR